MRKKIFFRWVVAFTLIMSMCFVGYGQNIPQPTATPTNMTSKYYRYIGYVGVDSGLFIPSRDSIFIPISGKPAITRRPQDQNIYYYDSTRSKWVELVNLPQLNDTLSSYVKIQTQNPTATLSGGGNYELHSSGTFTHTLNYSASRLAAGTNISATQPIASITVAGISEPTIGCNTPPCTISGTQSVTITYNTNTTFSNVVVTTDSKSATANTSFNFYSEYYKGYVSSNSPTDSDLFSAGYNFLNTSNSKNTSGNFGNPSSSSYIVFAYPSSFGTATVTINGLGVGYNLTQRNVTNQSGYTQQYNIYVSPFPTSSGVSYVIN